MKSLEFAIQMELDGEKYYLEQAEKNKGNNLNVVFVMLAEDERMHAKILRQNFDKESFELKEEHSITEYENVFKSVGDFKDKLKSDPGQLDAYRLALKKEEESIELYKDMLENAVSDIDRELFEFLIKEETMHYRIIDDIIAHLIRAEEWVESAEFGIRDDY